MLSCTKPAELPEAVHISRRSHGQMENATVTTAVRRSRSPYVLIRRKYKCRSRMSHPCRSRQSGAASQAEVGIMQDVNQCISRSAALACCSHACPTTKTPHRTCSLQDPGNPFDEGSVRRTATTCTRKSSQPMSGLSTRCLQKAVILSAS